MSAITFTYGTFDSASDAGVNEVALNEFSIDGATGALRFSTDIFVEADVSSGVEATEDASLVTRVQNVIDKLEVENADFELKVGTSKILDWDIAAFKAFNGKPIVTKPTRRGSTAKGQFIRFVLLAEQEPTGGRNGRRSDLKVAITYTTDRLRTVEFSGTWTQTESGTTLALARYLASASAYFAASWLDTGQVLAPQTNAVWQLIGTTVTPNDTNRTLRYSEKYRETHFASTPTNTTALIYTIGTFTRMDPPTHGAELGLSGGGGEESPFGGQSTTAGGGDIIPVASYKRFTVSTTTHVNDITLNLNTLWETVVRPWIVASVQAIFGSTRVIFEGPGVPIEDVGGKIIRCTTSIIQAAAGTIMLHEESLEFDNNRNLMAEVVYDGNVDEFDESEGGRRYVVTHNVRQEKLDQQPANAAYLGAPWSFMRETGSQSGVVIDPVVDQVKKFAASFARRYLYSRKFGNAAAAITAPAPLGRAGGGGGGAVVTPGGDQNGVTPL